MATHIAPEKKSHSDLIKLGMAERKAALDEDAEKRLVRIREERQAMRDSGGRYLAKVTPGQWHEMLELVSAGYNDKDICAIYDLHPSAMATKRREEPEFYTAYMVATAELFERLAKETLLVAEGEPGYTTGNVQRDRLVVKTRLALAEKLAPAIFGEKTTPQVAIQIVHTSFEDGIL